jgi:uncharacterized protein (TIGR03118 family)
MYTTQLRRGLIVLTVALGAAPLAWPAGNNGYVLHNLVADTPGTADFTDPGLVNGWGIAASPTGSFWVNDGGTGLSTVYGSNGAISATHAIVPPSAVGKSPSTPTGIVFNGTGGFLITARAPNFIFCTADGAISGWASANDATHALLQIDNSSAGAVYMGLAISSTSTIGPYIYAANIHSGKIDIFDTNYKPVALAGSFTDAQVPAGYAPFNIQNIGGKMYVMYAQQNPAKNFANSGKGLGYVSVFDQNGNLLQHLISQGNLNAPWGVAIASPNFGLYSNDLLIGNFGDGTINAYDPASGAYLGTLQDPSGNPVAISGLWALYTGNGGSGGDSNALYFAAGPGNEQHGLLGSLQAAPVISASSVVNAAGAQGILAPNTWVTIYGANLAATTRGWVAKDFNGNQLPTSLDGVSVSINGFPAFVQYVSPKQINVLTPVSVVQSNAVVLVSSNALPGLTANIPMQPFSLACFLYKNGPYVAAVHSDNVTPVGPATLYPNLSTPAKHGETVVIYATGFGPTNPVTPNGVTVTAPLALASAPTVMIGGITANVVFSGLTEPGVYQFNVTVPAGAANGDNAIVIQVNSFSTPSGGMLTVQN